jgi:hypothetical protein
MLAMGLNSHVASQTSHLSSIYAGGTDGLWCDNEIIRVVNAQ